MKTPVYSEDCCDECNQVIHNHIDCLVCNVKNAPTTHYDDLREGDEFNCEECGAHYTFSSVDYTGILHECYHFMVDKE